MGTKASRVLELFIESLNSDPELQTAYTCVALEEYFPDKEIDYAIMSGYVDYLGYEFLAKNQPNEVRVTSRGYALNGGNIVLGSLIPNEKQPFYKKLGEKIFNEKVRFKDAGYWNERTREAVSLRFGVLQIMATTDGGERVFKNL